MNKRIVCIVDDDPIFVYGTKFLLNHNRFFVSDILVFENGKEALDSLRNLVKSKKKLPDMIFLDLNMPVMDGWEFLNNYVNLPAEPKPPIIIVSSFMSTDELERAKSYAIVTQIIVKPLSNSILAELLLKL
jgi:CheY-like chemotaxis protein